MKTPSTKSHLIGCHEIMGSHADEHFIKNIMDEFKIKDKVAAIVSDNAINISTAVHQKGYKCGVKLKKNLNS